MLKEKPLRPYERNKNNKCTCCDPSERERTDKTPYRKGFCVKCSAWVFTDVNPIGRSVWGQKEKQPDSVKQHVHTKRILNKIVDDHIGKLKIYKQLPEKLQSDFLIESGVQHRRYHIPVKFVIQWSENKKRAELIMDIIPFITTVRN